MGRMQDSVMFWKKVERPINSDATKILLERKGLGGRPHLRKYVEQELPAPNGHPVGTVFCLTRRRSFWRFRLWAPLQSTYFTLNANGRWVQMCRTFH